MLPPNRLASAAELEAQDVARDISRARTKVRKTRPPLTHDARGGLCTSEYQPRITCVGSRRLRLLLAGDRLRHLQMLLQHRQLLLGERARRSVLRRRFV